MIEQKLKKGEFQKALAVYGQAVKAFQKGDSGKAAELFEAFIEKFPGELEVVDRAKIYLAIIRKQPGSGSSSLKSAEDYCYDGVSRMNDGDFEGALKSLDKALKMKEKEGRTHYLMSNAYCRMGQIDDCLDHLKKAIQKDKEFSVRAQNEPEFKSLWEDKKFKLITRLA